MEISATTGTQGGVQSRFSVSYFREEIRKVTNLVDRDAENVRPKIPDEFGSHGPLRVGLAPYQADPKLVFHRRRISAERFYSGVIESTDPSA